MSKRWSPLLAMVVVLVAATLALAGRPLARNFVARCTGAEEVPPRDTDARAVAVFRLSRDELSLTYALVVANIDNVIAAHIHVAAPGVNGPIVVPLAGDFPPGGGPSQGVLAQGTINEADLTGPLAGQPLSALIDEMRAGNTYVNVHTNDGVDPPNTGPGDFPGGEVRGQIDTVP
jgi:hypothetical protein